MDLTCEERPSNSRFIERVWRSHSGHGGAFTSIADTHYGMVVTRFRGKTMLTVRGPETHATPAFGPADAEFVGIHFRPGTFIAPLPAKMVMDRRDVNLPEASSKSFWLQGSTWQFPDYDNIETFVDWLFQDGLLVHDPMVGAVLRGQVPEVSLRTVQRRFLDATGLTRSTVCQIERARYATKLLRQGVGILDVVHQAGYADQPHMTRALRQMTGFTPAQMMSKDRQPLSFLFKTSRFDTASLSLRAHNIAPLQTPTPPLPGDHTVFDGQQFLRPHSSLLLREASGRRVGDEGLTHLNHCGLLLHYDLFKQFQRVSFLFKTPRCSLRYDTYVRYTAVGEPQ